MKKIFKSIVALLCCGAIFASCEQEVPEVNMSVDITSIEAEAQNPEDVAVYKIEDGRLIMLNSIDMKSEEMVINTLDLSRTMNDIYSEYIQLSNVTR